MSEFTRADLRFLTGIGLALGLRQVALLVVLPFLVLYAQALPGGSPALAGVALGVYGLTQGALQIPFGAWSDALGRKRVVLFGTALLLAGLLVAALAPDVTWLIVGRAVQGSGAVNGAAYAWVIERTAPDRLNRAMALVSTSVGLAAVASFVAGPILYTVLSLPQIFAGCAALVCLAGLYVAFATEDAGARSPASRTGDSADVWRSPALWRLVGAGFLANYNLMAVAFAVPLLLAPSLGRQLWLVLVPAAIVGVVATRVAAAAADRGGSGRVTSLACLAFLPSAVCLIAGGPLPIALGTALFMAGYLSLSALLPPAVTRAAPPEARGLASGAYNTGTFLGSFAGGVAMGLLWSFGPGVALGSMLVAWAFAQTLLVQR